MKTAIKNLLAIAIALLATTAMAQQEPPSNGSSGSGSSSSGGNIVITPISCPVGFVCSGIVPEQIPIQSFAILKAYALTLVDRLTADISGQSVTRMQDYVSISYPFRDADPEHMRSLLKARPLRFSADPNEELTSMIEYGADHVIPNWGFQIFYEEKKFKLENLQGGDSWVVPTDAKKLNLVMSDWIPFSLPGVQNAYIITTDEKGNQTGYYSFDQDNRLVRGLFIALGREHLGQHGKLYVDLDNNTKAIYDLDNSGKLTPTTQVASEGLDGSIEGVRTIPLNSSVITLQDGDQIVNAPFDDNVKGGSPEATVVFPPGLKQYPTAVYVISAAVFAANPKAEWKSFNPFTEIVKFAPTERVLIRFEYGETPGNLPVNQKG